jgi:ComF family protein
MTRYEREPSGQFRGNIAPKKVVATARRCADTKRTPPPSVKDFRELVCRLHFSLVEMEGIADKRPMVSLRQIVKPALDFALPERCPACGAITADGTNFCVDCWAGLRFLNPPWCAACALPFTHEQGQGTLCATCLSHTPLHNGIRAVVAYDERSRQIVLRLKYGGKIWLAKLVARALVRHLPDDRSGVMVVPVPLHWARLWSRTFNQSALIARELARLGGMDFCPDLLLRTVRTPSMRGLSLKERRKKVSKAFVVNPAKTHLISDARIILVDDVLTTGATSDGCIKTLKKSGAQWVQLFCWARALRGEALPENQPVTLDA